MAYSTGGLAYGGDLRRGGDRDNIIEGEQGMRHKQIDHSSDYEDDTQQGCGSDSFPLFLDEEVPIRVFNGYQDRGICGSTLKRNDFRQG